MCDWYDGTNSHAERMLGAGTTSSACGRHSTPDYKEPLRQLTVLAQSFCKGRGITESLVDWHNAQPEVSLVLGVMSSNGRLK